MSPHGAAKLVHSVWIHADGVFLLGIPSKARFSADFQIPLLLFAQLLKWGGSPRLSNTLSAPIQMA